MLYRRNTFNCKTI